MRVIHLRERRSDAGQKRTTGRRIDATKRSKRLYINPPLELGDMIVTTHGFEYQVLSEFNGVAKLPVVRNKGVTPRVLVWGFCCVACGQQAQTRKVASEKPVAKECSACLNAKRLAQVRTSRVDLA